MTSAARAGRCLAAGLLLAVVSVGTPRAEPLACIAEGTPAEKIAERIMASAQALPQAASVSDIWTRTATDGNNLVRGEPITLTWSVVPDGTAIDAAIPSAGESSDPSDLRAYLDLYYGNENLWRGFIQDALDGWSQGPGIRFVYESNDDGVKLNTSRGILGVRGDIRLGGHSIDGDYGTVAYAFFPTSGGDMVIDTADTFNTSLLPFQNVVAHEIGHALGLGHVCPINATKLMEPIISTSYSGPQFDDLLGAHRNYGDVEEENDVAAEASDVGLTVDSTTDLTDVALDGTGDDDWFVVPAGTRSEVSIAVDPAGSQYQLGATSTSDCSGVSTPLFDPRDIQDLSVAVYDFDGSTSLASADATSTGGSEILSDVRLSSFGGFVRVSGGGIDDAQRYDLEITLVPEPSQKSLAAAAVGTVVGLAVWTRRRDSRA